DSLTRRARSASRSKPISKAAGGSRWSARVVDESETDSANKGAPPGAPSLSPASDARRSGTRVGPLAYAAAKKSMSSWYAFSLVVMHPVRRVGEALQPVEVGHVVGVGLGEVGAEVGIALPPDDQRRRRDRAELRCGFLLRLPYRGAVVVDHPGPRPRLRPPLHAAPPFPPACTAGRKEGIG